MKLLLHTIFAVFILSSCGERSLEIGEVYQTLDGKYVIEVISRHELEMTGKGKIFLADYLLKGNRLRIVTNRSGTKMVYYFEFTEEGLRDGNNLYYSKASYAKEQARIFETRQGILMLENGLNIYKLMNYSYPSTAQSLEALITKPTGSPKPKNWEKIIDRLPKDAWGQPYQYLNPGVHGKIDVYSLGSDQQSSDDDIGNWDSGQWQRSAPRLRD